MTSGFSQSELEPSSDQVVGVRAPESCRLGALCGRLPQRADVLLGDVLGFAGALGHHPPVPVAVGESTATVGLDADQPEVDQGVTAWAGGDHRVDVGVAAVDPVLDVVDLHTSVVTSRVRQRRRSRARMPRR